MSYIVMTDGSVDVPANDQKALDIPIVPPLVLIDGEELLSGVEISNAEFFERQAHAASLPKTSQPAPGQFSEAYQKALETYERILYIGISAGLSGTINSARTAAAEFPADKIVIHDSMTLSGDSGMQVMAAARVRARGGSLEEALAAAKKVQATSRLYFTVDDMTYLIKGGRVGRVQGAIGGFLNIKPLITVEKSDGKFQPHSRIRTFKAVMSKLVELAVEVVGRGKKGRFLVLHGNMLAEVEQIGNEIRNACDVVYMETVQVGPTLAAHTGPRALGVVAVPGDWE